MKEYGTPREVLLARHRSAERKLDKIRADVLRECLRPAEPPSASLRFARAWQLLYREIFAPAKTTWALVAAAWLLIVGFNLANRLPSRTDASPMARGKQPSSDTLMAFREQEQLLRELIGPFERSTDVERPRRKRISEPRSEGIQSWRTA